MHTNAKIFVAGHRGMVGGAILRELQIQGYSNLLTRSSDHLDLRNQAATLAFLQQEKPEYVVVAAAKVGGILANNTYRAEFLYDNLAIQNNLIHGSYLVGVKKLLFLGSSCIYPKMAPQPLKEEYLLTGPLEQTNEPYAIAKIAGIKLCEAYYDQYGCCFIGAMPTNLYGPGDNYHPQNSHVLPALICRFHEAKTNGSSEVVIWGSGNPLREFLYADDLAKACVFLLKHYEEKQFVNVGSGQEISIASLANLVAEIVGFQNVISFDTSKPDGTPRKLMDSSRMNNMGWKPEISLAEGIRLAYRDFLQNHVET